MNFFRAGIFSLAALFIFQNAALALSVTYDQKVSIGGQPVATSKVVYKDKKMRADTNIGGMTVVKLRNEKGSYNYFPDQKAAQKIPPSLDEVDAIQDYPSYIDYLEKNQGKKVGSEKVDGKETDIYTFTEPNHRSEAKAWVWREQTFPLKVQVNSPDGLAVVELSNINFAPNIDGAVFQLAPGTQVTDLGTDSNASS